MFKNTINNLISVDVVELTLNCYLNECMVPLYFNS